MSAPLRGRLRWMSWITPASERQRSLLPFSSSMQSENVPRGTQPRCSLCCWIIVPIAPSRAMVTVTLSNAVSDAVASVARLSGRSWTPPQDGIWPGPRPFSHPVSPDLRGQLRRSSSFTLGRRRGVQAFDGSGVWSGHPLGVGDGAEEEGSGHRASSHDVPELTCHCAMRRGNRTSFDLPRRPKTTIPQRG